MNAVADIDARQIVLARRLRDVRKIKVEHHFGAINCQRPNQVRVEHALLIVHHEVGIKPVIQSPPAGSDRAYFIILIGTDHRTRLQAEVFAIFNRVAAVVEHAVETFVQVRHVIAAVKIIVDEDFPVAVQTVATPLDPMKILKSQTFDLSNKVLS